MKYEDDDRFSGYYFEDSYVLGIEITPKTISFRMEIVLTPSHPLYHPAAVGEQHCYKIGALIFENILEVPIQELSMTPSTDASGTVDFGNIDEFSEESPQHYHLSGDWGRMAIFALSARVELVDQEG